MEDSYQNAKNICRLCLKICDKYEAVERSIRNNMDVLLLNINLLLSEEPVICKNCNDIVKKCFNFKTMCLDAYKYIISFVNDKSNIKIDVKNIYLSKKEYDTGVLKDCSICGFCMGLVESCFAISLDNEDDNTVQKMFQKCFPELDFSIVKEPIICVPCHGHLKEYFSFVTNCLFVEEEIGKYCQTLDIKLNKSLIDLTDVLQFTLRNKVTGGEHVNTIGKNKEDRYRIHPEVFNKVDEHENESVTELEDQKLNNILQFPLRNVSFDIIDNDGSKLELHREFCDSGENIVEEEHEEFKCDLETITIEDYKYDNTLFSSRFMSKEVGVTQKAGNFLEGQIVQKNEYHEAVEEKYLVNDEIKIETDPHDFSSFQSDSSKLVMSDDFLKDRKSSELDQHLLDPLKVRMYQCESCPFQTKHKHNLTRHSVIHKDPSKVTMYRCESCLYQSKRKYQLKKHLLVHKNTSEAKMYQCESCPFKTKSKRYLETHSLVHKDPSKVYRCDFCPYQTTHKNRHDSHLLVHKNTSEITMYQCESCPFKTKHKYNLKTHSLVHKDPSKVTMCLCEFCPFQTKLKNQLKRHLLVHEDSSEVIMYKCESCPYETRHKRNLTRHALVHTDPSNVTMYRCESCPYQTKHRSKLNSHLLVHKDTSEIIMYQCESCPFQTKRKSYLKKHSLVHKEVTMYRCESCPYETIHKDALKSHYLLTHKDPSKVVTI